MLINKDIYLRLAAIVDHFAKGAPYRFAQELGLSHSTLLDYLKPSGQHKVKVSLLYQIFEKYPEIDLLWLLTGNGEMLGEGETSRVIPAEELNEKLTPTQREMLTFQRIMKECGAPPDKIINGIEAIAMGKASTPKSGYKTAEPPADPGYNNIHESLDDFGKDI